MFSSVDIQHSLQNCSATPNVARETAITQIKGLHLALEQRRVLPYRLRVTFVVRGESRAQLADRARQVVRRVGSIGGKAHLLKWEQLEGLRQVVPIRASRCPTATTWSRPAPWPG